MPRSMEAAADAIEAERDYLRHRLASAVGSLETAKKTRDRLRRLNAELVAALGEVVAISDRKHDAWDRAKAVIAKATAAA